MFLSQMSSILFNTLVDGASHGRSVIAQEKRFNIQDRIASPVSVGSMCRVCTWKLLTVLVLELLQPLKVAPATADRSILRAASQAFH